MYHLWQARVPGGCALQTFAAHTVCIHSQSTTPLGPWTEETPQVKYSRSGLGLYGGQDIKASFRTSDELVVQVRLAPPW